VVFHIYVGLVASNLAFIVNDSKHEAKDCEDSRQEVKVSYLVEDFVVIGLGTELHFLDIPAVC